VGHERVHGALVAHAAVAAAQKHRIGLAVKAQQALARHVVFLGRQLSSEVELQGLYACGGVRRGNEQHRRNKSTKNKE